MPKKAKCPLCESMITYLKVKEVGTDYVNESVRRYGESNLEGEDIETDDSETIESDIRDSDTDERFYYCPCCDEELSPGNLEIIETETEKIVKKITKPDPISTQEAAKQELLRQDHYRFHQNVSTFYVCPKCETKVEILIDNNHHNHLDNHTEEEVECTSCREIITEKTAKQIITS